MKQLRRADSQARLYDPQLLDELEDIFQSAHDHLVTTMTPFRRRTLTLKKLPDTIKEVLEEE